MAVTEMSGVDGEFEFPGELVVQPFALVAVAGLDSLNNAVHRTIWDALTNSRAQNKLPVMFKQLTLAHEFPRPKIKRVQYDMHIPKGIFKRNWMSKYLSLVPAVVVLFYDLDWDDPQWEEKHVECISRVQSLRLALEGRNSRICVVLIQRNAILPSGEDALATDRALSLVQSADLTNKSLFILPQGDNLYGFTARLEKAFYDFAALYYLHEIKNIKTHREHLNKKTHQYLYVRHQFKMGFLSELRQDLISAHGHYSEAYSQLLEVRVTETNEFEVKTVAGYIAYKVCKMLFQLNKARDAISQFKAHVEHYKHRTGAPLLLFQHHAWLSKQFSIFADLFDEMVRQGSSAVQTQHPGFYYQLAAKHASDRRVIASQLCSAVSHYPDPDPLAGKDILEFYGQRPWRPCKLSAEPLDPDRERQGILALQFVEKNFVNHSDIIINLYGSAVSQFKIYRCPRMRRHLFVQMAQEYYTAMDYGKSLTLLTHMLWDYRNERWGLILDSLLQLALNCAYLTASISEYLPLCLEVASRQLEVHSIRALNNLITVSKGGLPLPEPGVNISSVPRVNELWVNSRVSEQITIELDNIHAGINCKATVIHANYALVEIKIAIKCDLPETITFSKLIVCVSNATGIIECPVDLKEFIFSPSSVAIFMCQFKPQATDVGKLIKISSVILRLGDLDDRLILFKFTGQGKELSNIPRELSHFRQVSKNVGEYMAISPVLSHIVHRRLAKMEVKFDHYAPALLGEWFRVKVIILSCEEDEISNATMTVSLNDDSTVEHSTDVCLKVGDDLVSLPLTINLENIPAKEKLVKEFYIKANGLGVRHIDIKVTYKIYSETCVKEAAFSSDVVDAFSYTTKYYSLKLEELTEGLFTQEPFLLHVNIVATSPWPITILSTAFRLGESISEVDKYKCPLGGVVLGKGEAGTCVTCLGAEKPSENPFHVASLIITWIRSDKESGVSATVSVVVLSPVDKVSESLVKVSLETPAQGTVRALFPVTYTITNCTSKLFTFQLNMEASEAFMFSGHKQLLLHVLPESTRELQYNLYPLLCGPIKLPRLHLSSLVDCLPQSILSQVLERSLPTTVYVIPQAKCEKAEKPTSKEGDKGKRSMESTI